LSQTRRASGVSFERRREEKRVLRRRATPVHVDDAPRSIGCPLGVLVDLLDGGGDGVGVEQHHLIEEVRSQRLGDLGRDHFRIAGRRESVTVRKEPTSKPPIDGLRPCIL